MSDDRADIANYGLDEKEQQLLYNVEVLRLPVSRAGEVAGIANPHAAMQRPHVLAAREQLKMSLRDRTNITRDDVIQGLREAIEQAVVLADPMAQIAGWREVAKILGFDKTPNVNIHLNGSLAAKQIQAMPLEELMRLSGNENVLDTDFYRVASHEQ